MPDNNSQTPDWQKFFSTARGWIFQAAPCTPGAEDKPSIGSMETMYQAFKARMLAEQELDMTHDF